MLLTSDCLRWPLLKHDKLFETSVKVHGHAVHSLWSVAVARVVHQSWNRGSCGVAVTCHMVTGMVIVVHRWIHGSASSATSTSKSDKLEPEWIIDLHIFMFNVCNVECL